MFQAFVCPSLGFELTLVPKSIAMMSRSFEFWFLRRDISVVHSQESAKKIVIDFLPYDIPFYAWRCFDTLVKTRVHCVINTRPDEVYDYCSRDFEIEMGKISVL